MPEGAGGFKSLYGFCLNNGSICLRVTWVLLYLKDQYYHPLLVRMEFVAHCLVVVTGPESKRAGLGNRKFPRRFLFLLSSVNVINLSFKHYDCLRNGWLILHFCINQNLEPWIICRSRGLSVNKILASLLVYYWTSLSRTSWHGCMGCVITSGVQFSNGWGLITAS